LFTVSYSTNSHRHLSAERAASKVKRPTGFWLLCITSGLYLLVVAFVPMAALIWVVVTILFLMALSVLLIRFI